jgi:hypothetical protein
MILSSAHRRSASIRCLSGIALRSSFAASHTDKPSILRTASSLTELYSLCNLPMASVFVVPYLKRFISRDRFSSTLRRCCSSPQRLAALRSRFSPSVASSAASAQMDHALHVLFGGSSASASVPAAVARRTCTPTPIR